ncbi:MAG: nucleotidyl transferase AbiEii/AbiGii toxin family protein [bacterium]|nr:nucleotidyl transferase AbiEii/AbiGii toxin family protein [bacterium]
MKSIEDTLTLVADILVDIGQSIEIRAALVGGYAVISHGVGRTTIDVDFLIYAEAGREDFSQLVDLFKAAVPGNFEIKAMEGSRMLGDPFPYNVLFLTDQSGNYPKMDFIIPRYKWELEGLQKAKPLAGIPFPVLSVPYLIAMKLRAGGPRDHSDILDLYRFLSDEDKAETHRLATLIKRDKNLDKLLAPQKTYHMEPEDEDLLL